MSILTLDIILTYAKNEKNYTCQIFVKLENIILDQFWTRSR